MFKKFAEIQDQKERIEIFNLLKINLSLCLIMLMAVVLFFLIMILGQIISFSLYFPNSDSGAAFWLGRFAAIFLMLGLIFLARLPVLMAQNQLRADFGLDSRPFSSRFKWILASEFRSWLLAGALSAISFVVLLNTSLLLWVVITLPLLLICLTINLFFPHIYQPQNLRLPKKGEFSAKMLAKIDQWSPKTGLLSSDILISTDFKPELDLPTVEWHKFRLRLIISEKALHDFPCDQLRLALAFGVLGWVVKMPLKIFLLRFFVLAAGVPITAILISTVGVAQWAYPLVVSPAIVTLIWLGAGFSLTLYYVVLGGLFRALNTQLATASAMILKDDDALEGVLKTLAEKNLESESPPWWQKLFHFRHSRSEFLKRAKFQQHLANFTE
ncbi:MAG: hypothetical protein ACRCTY_10950 [Candidatus Adiutrix sp.]